LIVGTFASELYIIHLIIPLREAINTIDGLALLAFLYDLGRETTHVC